jgi:O-antigen/teichoic acid export membrane protein
VLQRLASVVLIPGYTRYLDPAAYGVLELLDLTVGLLALFVGSTYTCSLYYFQARAKDAAERDTSISTALFGAMLLGSVGATTGALLAVPLSRLVFQSPGYAHYFRVSFAVFAFSLPLEMCYACLRAMNRPVAFTVASVARLAVTTGATLFYLVALRWGVLAVIAGNLTGTILMSVALTFSCLRPIPAPHRRLHLPLFWRQIRYAAPSVLVGVSTTVLNAGDRYFLQRFVPLAEVGLYSFAYRGGMLVSYCQQAFANYWSAQIYTVVDHKDGAAIFSRLFTYFMLVMTFVGICLSLFAGPAVILLTAPAYHPAIVFVPWVVAVYLVRGAGDFFRPIVYAKAKTHLDALLNLTAAAICLAGYALLIPHFRAWGAIAATAIGFTASAIYAWHLARRLHAFQLETSRLARVLGLALLDVFLVHRFGTTHIAGQILGAVAGAAAYPVALLASGFLTPGEWVKLRDCVASISKSAWLTRRAGAVSKAASEQAGR